MNDNNKLILYIAIAGILGGIIGAGVTGLSVHAVNNSASLLDTIGGFFTGLIPQSLRLAPGNTASSTEAAPYVAPTDYEQRIIQAVEKADPGVVSIIITKDIPVLEQCPYDPLSDVPQEFRQFFNDGGQQFTQPCDTGKTTRQEVGGGSGFVLSPDGMIVTNKHVISDTKAAYTVFANDGKKYQGVVLARDPILDFAVLKIDAAGLTPLPLGDSDSIKLGQTAIAIGNALGEYRNTVSVGVVSGLARDVSADGASGTENIHNVIQTDAAINPGNSGGPLLNLKGEVIGINTAVASGAQNIGFSIPINQVKRAINSIKANGKIIIPYLGVRYITITEDVAKREKLVYEYGALIRGNESGSAIVKDSPAAGANIKAEDIILEVNSRKIDRVHTLGDLIQQAQVGETVTLKIDRAGEILEVRITLAERPNL